MASLARLSPTRSWLLAVAIPLAGVLLTPPQVRAEIVLDEFTDSATAIVQSFGNPIAETDNVGDLAARREIRFATGGADPFGSFDINVTSPGKMIAEIRELHRQITGTPLTAVQFNYYFAPTDVTEGGQNNAILFDFAELRGDIQPTFLRAWVLDDTHLKDSFIIELRPLVENLSPHTLAAPFDQFTSRGGALRRPDPTTLKTILFDFYFIGHTGELNWSAQLERIRFGVVPVPEPSAALMWLGLLPWMCHWRFPGKGGRQDDDEWTISQLDRIAILAGDRANSCGTAIYGGQIQG